MHIHNTRPGFERRIHRGIHEGRGRYWVTGNIPYEGRGYSNNRRYLRVYRGGSRGYYIPHGKGGQYMGLSIENRRTESRAYPIRYRYRLNTEQVLVIRGGKYRRDGKEKTSWDSDNRTEVDQIDTVWRKW